MQQQLPPPLRISNWLRAPTSGHDIPNDPPPLPPPSHPQEIRSFQGYYAPFHKTVLYYAIGVLTLGISFLVCKWSPRLHILLTLSQCPLRDAQFVRITVSAGGAQGARLTCLLPRPGALPGPQLPLPAAGLL